MTDRDDSLDELFRVARAAPPTPGDDFMARILDDALRLQPQPQGLVPARSPARRLGLWTRLAATLGGALAVAGVGTAAMAGLVIGYVQPEPMLTLAGTMGLGSSETVEVLAGFDGLLAEETLP